MDTNKDKDLENEKWINAKITIQTTSTELIRVKKDMEKYAEELDWGLIIDKKGEVDETGIRFFELKLAPRGGISPEGLREIREKLLGFVISILRDIINISIDNPFRAITKIGISKDLKNIITATGMSENSSEHYILFTESPIGTFVELETKHHGLCNAAFGITLKWYKNQLENELNSYRYWFGFNKSKKEDLNLEITKLKELGI